MKLSRWISSNSIEDLHLVIAFLAVIIFTPITLSLMFQFYVGPVWWANFLKENPLPISFISLCLLLLLLTPKCLLEKLKGRLISEEYEERMKKMREERSPSWI